MPDLYVKKRDETPQRIDGELQTRPSSVSREQRRKIDEMASGLRVPEGIRFETQSSEEKIILLLRAHPITNFVWIIIVIVMAIAPLFLGLVPVFGFLPERFLTVITVFWYLITFAFALEQFLNWYFNVYIVTDERIVDVDFVNLLFKRVSEAKIDKIQDVTYSVGGVVRSVFNYGNVLIQTAAEVTQFEFHAVPQPNKVASILRALVTEEEIEAMEGRVS